MKLTVTSFCEHRTAARQGWESPNSQFGDLPELRAAIGCTCCYQCCCCCSSCTAAIRAVDDPS